MNKIIISAALVVASWGAKAQMSSLYVGKSSIEGLKVEKFTYTRFSHSETVVKNDTTYTFDWQTMQMVIDGDGYPIEKAFLNIELHTLEVQFDNRMAYLEYDPTMLKGIRFKISVINK